MSKNLKRNKFNENHIICSFVYFSSRPPQQCKTKYVIPIAKRTLARIHPATSEEFVPHAK